jgi:ribosomal protein S17E
MKEEIITSVTDPKEVRYCQDILDRFNLRNQLGYLSHSNKSKGAEIEKEIRSVEVRIFAFERSGTPVRSAVKTTPEKLPATKPLTDYQKFLTNNYQRKKQIVEELKASEERAGKGFIWNGYSNRVIDAIIDCDRAKKDLDKETGK